MLSEFKSLCALGKMVIPLICYILLFPQYEAQKRLDIFDIFRTEIAVFIKSTESKTNRSCNMNPRVGNASVISSSFSHPLHYSILANLLNHFIYELCWLINKIHFLSIGHSKAYLQYFDQLLNISLV